MRSKTANATAALLLWAMVAAILIAVGVGTFIVPKMVEGWKAQGLKEAPVGWQLVVDAADFSIHRGWWLIPFLFLLAIFFTRRTLKAASSNM